MEWMEWYNNLAKPSWTPTGSTIGMIWQILYPIIIVTFGFVFVQTFRRKLRTCLRIAVTPSRVVSTSDRS